MEVVTEDAFALKTTDWDDIEEASGDDGIDLVVLLEIIVGCLGLVGNFTCIIVLRRHSVRNQTNWLIVNQAVVDCLTSAILMAASSTKLAGVTPTDMDAITASFFCKFWASYGLVFSGFAISTFNLMAISVERYLAVIHPIWYLSYFRRRAVAIFIVLSWLLAPILQIVTISTQYGVLESGHCNFYAQNSELLVALFFWEYFLPVCIMTFSFASILRKFRHLNKIADDRGQELTAGLSTKETSVRMSTTCNQDAPSPNPTLATRSNRLTVQPAAVYEPSAVSQNDGPSSASQSERPADRRGERQKNPKENVYRRNTTKVLVAVYLLYLICWSPNQWAFLQFNLGGYLDFGSGFYRFTVIMGLLNTCINPFLYALRLKVYKRELKNMIGKCFG